MKKVFLVEDDVAIVDVYQTMMEKAGFNVQVFGLGLEAIKTIQEIKNQKEVPGVVLLDLILPDANGAEVLSAVRENPVTKKVKVFILTNQENSEAQFPKGVKSDKFIIKANTTPTQLIKLLEKEF